MQFDIFKESDEAEITGLLNSFSNTNMIRQEVSETKL